MTPDHRRELQRIIDTHDDILRALRASTDAIDESDAALGTTSHPLHLLIDAQDRALARNRAASAANREAIDAALAANRAVLDLLNRLDNGGTKADQP